VKCVASGTMQMLDLQRKQGSAPGHQINQELRAKAWHHFTGPTLNGTPPSEDTDQSRAQLALLAGGQEVDLELSHLGDARPTSSEGRQPEGDHARPWGTKRAGCLWAVFDLPTSS
jgi:hypothetical protein